MDEKDRLPEESFKEVEKDIKEVTDKYFNLKKKFEAEEEKERGLLSEEAKKNIILDMGDDMMSFKNKLEKFSALNDEINDLKSKKEMRLLNEEELKD